MRDFAAYLGEIAKEFPSRKALAEAIGIVAPRLSRVLAGDDPYAFSVESCLRLARAANRPPGEVLRAAGKPDVADLLEHLFPRAGRPSVTGEQRSLLDDWELLTDPERRAIRALIQLQVGDRKRKHA